MVHLNGPQRAALQSLLFTTEQAPTLGELAERYRTEHLYVDGLAKNTIAWREIALDRLKPWSKRPVDGRFRDVACALYERHGQASGSLAVNTLNRILLLAKAWGFRSEAPDLQKLARVRSNPRTSIVNAEHRSALLEQLEAQPSERLQVAADVVRLVLYTGMRITEACTVEWEHVALKESRLMLPRTKSRRVRLVPLCEEARKIVDAQPRGTWVFPARDGNGPINRRQPEQVIRDACKAAKIPVATPRVLRHTWGTEAMRAGVPEKVAMMALGHSSPVELARYQHAKVSDVEMAMHAVAAAIGGRR